MPRFQRTGPRNHAALRSLWLQNQSNAGLPNERKALRNSSDLWVGEATLGARDQHRSGKSESGYEICSEFRDPATTEAPKSNSWPRFLLTMRPIQLEHNLFHFQFLRRFWQARSRLALETTAID
jgi:hypothetical protein